MLACPCPRCGKPVRLGLFRDDLACSACGHAGPLPPDVLGEVQRSRAVVGQAGAHERQIQGSLRAIVAAGSSVAFRAGFAAALSLTPIALLGMLVGLGALVDPDTTGNAFVLTLVAAAIALTAMLVFAFARSLAARQRRLERAFSALPPLVPGGPAACHTCGADLDQDARGVVRCRYCQSDNVIRADVLAFLAGSHAEALSALHGAAERDLAAMRKAGFSAGIRTVLAAVGAPLSTFVFFLVFAAIYDSSSSGYDEAARYVLVSEQGRTCVGQPSGPPNARLVIFGPSRLPFLPQRRALTPAEDQHQLRAADLIGKTLESKERTGTVKSIQGGLIAGNAGVVGGDLQVVTLLGSCLAQPPGTPPATTSSAKKR